MVKRKRIRKTIRMVLKEAKREQKEQISIHRNLTKSKEKLNL